MRLSPCTKGRGSVGEIIAGMSPSASMSLSDLAPFFNLDAQARRRRERDVLAAVDQPGDRAVVEAVMLLQDAAHPDIGGRLEIGAADDLAVEVLRFLDAGLGVDEDEAVAEAAMQEDGNGGERLALVADHVIGADVLLADVELVLAAHAPVPLARAHLGEEDQLETFGLDRAFDQRLHDIVVAGGDRQPELAHSTFLVAGLVNCASARSDSRRGARFR